MYLIFAIRTVKYNFARMNEPFIRSFFIERIFNVVELITDSL